MRCGLRPTGYWVALLLAAFAGGASGSEEGLTFHLTFDDKLAPALSRATHEVLGSAEVAFVRGKIGQAADLTAPGASLRFPLKGLLDPRQGTIALWYRPNWNGAETPEHSRDKPLHFLFYVPPAKGTGDPYPDSLRISATRSGRVGFYIIDPGEPARERKPVEHYTRSGWNYTKLWRAGEWHHVGATWDCDGDTTTGSYRQLMSLYVDGHPIVVPDNQRAITLGEHNFGWNAAGGEAQIGTGLPPTYRGQPAAGAIDDLRIYDRALDETEMAALAEGTAGVPATETKPLFTVPEPAAPATAEADKLDLVPAPKELRLLGSPVPLARGGRAPVIVADLSDRTSAIGAEELNARVTELGEKPLEVIDAAKASRPDELLNRRAFVVGSIECPLVADLCRRHRVQLSADDPGTQGYVIRSLTDDHGLILLGGSDSMGALYACVTARSLLARQDGNLTYQPVNVRDWPDFKWRMFNPGWSPYMLGAMYPREGRPPLEQTCRELIDWHLRYKINALEFSTSALQEPDVLRPACDYAAERGMARLLHEGVSICRVGGEGSVPGFSEEGLMTLRGRYYTWSRDDLIKWRAGQIGEAIKAANIDHVWLHSVDTGDENWEGRSQLCRQRWPGKSWEPKGRVGASAHLYNLLYQGIREVCPDAKITFILRPYSVPSERWQRYHYDSWVQRVMPMMPRDVLVCVREAARPGIEAFRAAYQRSLLYYVEYQNRWGDLFLTSPRWNKTFYFDDDNDVIRCETTSWTRHLLTSLVAAEFSWNVNAPGGELWPEQGRYRFETEHCEPKQVAESLMARCARSLYGREAAPYLQRVASAGLKIRLGADPEPIIQGLNVGRRARGWPALQLTEVMREQWMAAQRAREAVDELWGLDPAMEPFARAEFAYLYKVSHIYESLAEHWYRYFATRDAIHAGDMEAVDRHLAAGMAAVETLVIEWPQVAAEAARGPQMIPYGRWIPEKFGFPRPERRPDWAPLAEKFHDLSRDRALILKSANLSPEVTRQIRDRQVFARPVDQAPLTDGKLDDAAWAQAVPVRSFCRLKEPQLALEQTRAWVVYGKDALYVAFDCLDREPASLRTPATGRDDGRVFEGDVAELFLDTNANGETYDHLAVGANGHVFDESTGRGFHQRLDWNTEFEAAATLTPEGWAAELAIPFESLGVKPVAGDRWGINLARGRPRGTHNSEYSQIKFLGLGVSSGFHQVARYAPLLFVEPGPYGLAVHDRKLVPATHEDRTTSYVDFKLAIAPVAELADLRLTCTAANPDTGQTSKPLKLTLQDLANPDNHDRTWRLDMGHPADLVVLTVQCTAEGQPAMAATYRLKR